MLVLQTGMSKSINAVFSYATFNVPGAKPYVESYLSISPNNLKNKLTGGKYQKSALIDFKIYKKDSVVYADKFALSGQAAMDSLSTNAMQLLNLKRIELPNGLYLFSVQVSDVNNADTKVSFDQSFRIEFGNTAQFSDIELVESVSKAVGNDITTKNGVNIVPMVNNVFTQYDSLLNFYTELYYHNLSDKN